jgi:hypothetical protein
LCWGRNNYGQLGNGSIGGQSEVPIHVSGGYNFSSLYLGSDHSCGLLNNGSVLCWGYNKYGQLGNGTSGGIGTITTYVSGEYNFSSVILGASHSCGLLNNGSVLCWGRNIYGQLGNGSIGDSPVPIYVSGEYNFSSISLGAQHSCGILENGSLLCWGLNNYGQLGNGSTGDSSIPIYVSGEYNFSSIKTGGGHNCGILNNESVLCWGYNPFGQLGIGSASDTYIPTLIAKGRIFGKSYETYEMVYLTNGFARTFIVGNHSDVNLNEDWNNVIYSYDGTKGNIYLNGDYYNNFSVDIAIQDSLVDISIGKDARGQIDEILMWNRTLSDAEIAQVYRSSLQQRNHTSWEFYSQQTLPSIGTYTYKLFAKDSAGWFSVIRNIIKYVEEDDDEDDDSGGGSGGTTTPPAQTITQTKLQQGETKQLRQGNVLMLQLSAGEQQFRISQVKVDEKVVEVEVVNETYVIPINLSLKIDTNKDNYYDLEVFLEDVSKYGSGKLTFKEIYEEIGSEEEESVSEESHEGEDSGLTQEEIAKERKKWIVWVIVASVVFVLGLMLLYPYVKDKWGSSLKKKHEGKRRKRK